MVISAQRFMSIGPMGSKNDFLTFKNEFNTSGYHNLSEYLTINGTTVKNTCRYEGGSATTSAWTATTGTDIAIAGSGTDPVIDYFAPGLIDSRVDFKAGKCFAKTASTYADGGSNDIVVEMIYKPATTTKYEFAKRAGSNDQYAFLLNGTNLVFYYSGVYCAIAVEPDKWHHIIVFVDKSGSMAMYGNAVASGSTVVSAQTNIGDGGMFTIGNYDQAQPATHSSISYLAIWQSPSWLDSHLQADLAKQRFHQCCGVYPQTAKGTALPTVATRSTSAYLDKIDSSDNRILIPVGAEWLRCCSRPNDAGTDTLSGYLSEVAAHNEILYSEDFANAAWDVTRVAISSNAATAPDGTETADGLVGSALSNTHYVGQAIASTSDEHEFSVFLKSGDKTWAKLDIPSVAQAECYYDLDSCAVGTSAANASGLIEDWGNGWCRCTIIYTGGAPSHSHDVYAADADEDDSFAGDASTINIYMWGAMHDHSGIGKATSYVKTTSAEVSRTKDQLRFVAGANIGGEDVGKGTIEFKYLMTSSAVPVANDALFIVTDGGASTARVYLYRAGTTGYVNALVTAAGATQASIADSSSALDGEIHTAVVKYATNNTSFKVDSTVVGTDTVCTIPDDLDRMEIGNYGLAYQPNGLISALKIYKKPV